MKTLATTLSAVVLMVSFSSCSWLKEKYAKNEKASVAYLSEKKSAPAKMNIEGLWYSPQWGIVVLNQERDGKLSGIFRDHYVVDGVVSGNNAVHHSHRRRLGGVHGGAQAKKSRGAHGILLTQRALFPKRMRGSSFSSA